MILALILNKREHYSSRFKKTKNFKNDPATILKNFLPMKIVACCPYFSYEKKNQPSKNLEKKLHFKNKMVVKTKKILVTGLRKEIKFPAPQKNVHPLDDISSGLY